MNSMKDYGTPLSYVLTTNGGNGQSMSMFLQDINHVEDVVINALFVS